MEPERRASSDRGRSGTAARCLAALLFLALACSPSQSPVEIGEPTFGDSVTRFDIALAPGFVPGTLSVTIDGVPVTTSFAETAWGATGRLVTAPGVGGTLEVSARFRRNGVEEQHSDARRFAAPVPAPALVASDPVPDSSAVPRTAWLRLEFEGAVPEATRRSFALRCGSGGEEPVPQEVSLYALRPSALVVNPVGELPPASRCTLSWPGAGGRESLSFETAPAGPTAEVRYDRTLARPIVPYPDDLYTVEDRDSATGVRLAVPDPGAPADVSFLFGTLLPETNRIDGFSPIGHFTLELSDAPDPASLPQTPADSLDPLATVALLDLSPGDGYGKRVPFRLEVRNDISVLGDVSHSLLLFPSVPLTPGGRFGLVVTTRALVSPSRPLDPSPFFRAALGAATPGEHETVGRVRALAAEVLEAAATTRPPIPADDVALALRVSIRSTDSIPNDLLAIKSQVLSAPPPGFTITKVVAETQPGSPVAAIVEGTWDAPDWRSNGFLVRDGDGVPVRQGTRAVPFVLALPRASLAGPAPITMYQHGNPGSAEHEVPQQARGSLAGAGFAVVGFTDPLNREIAPHEADRVAKVTAQIFAIFQPFTQAGRIPDYWLEANAEQLAFVRMLSGMGTIDVLPVGAPDGVPDLDPTLPFTYVGISEGANHGPGLLPYAPEIKAAALVAGGRRFTEVLVHQQAPVILSQIGSLFQNATPAEIWSALAMFQGLFDAQDEHNHARFLYRDPFAIAGTTRRASILLVEGLDDSLVPNHATESLAFELGPLAHLSPVQRSVPFLTAARSPVVGNIDAETSAAFFQFGPVGAGDVAPTPGCAALPPASASEGHHCAQNAAEALRQRTVFFQSALVGVPRIIDPFSG